jgi:hypothetical protein
MTQLCHSSWASSYAAGAPGRAESSWQSIRCSCSPAAPYMLPPRAWLVTQLRRRRRAPRSPPSCAPTSCPCSGLTPRTRCRPRTWPCRGSWNRRRRRRRRRRSRRCPGRPRPGRRPWPGRRAPRAPGARPPRACAPPPVPRAQAQLPPQVVPLRRQHVSMSLRSTARRRPILSVRVTGWSRGAEAHTAAQAMAARRGP